MVLRRLCLGWQRFGTFLDINMWFNFKQKKSYFQQQICVKFQFRPIWWAENYDLGGQLLTASRERKKSLDVWLGLIDNASICLLRFLYSTVWSYRNLSRHIITTYSGPIILCIVGKQASISARRMTPRGEQTSISAEKQHKTKTNSTDNIRDWRHNTNTNTTQRNNINSSDTDTAICNDTWWDNRV